MSEIDNHRVISGFRPTNDLTVGQYLGAIKPALKIQNDPNAELYLFVADILGITNNDPRTVAPYRHEIVKDCMALGVDPVKTNIYMQSDVETSVIPIANRIARYVSVSELTRIPTLKDLMRPDLRENEFLNQANLAMFNYPTLMAADIFAQEADLVAAGEDQSANVELARNIARTFNSEFGEPILVEPRLLAIDAPRILALDGKSKMATDNPEQSILLSDDPERARAKIRASVTTVAGSWTDVLASHFAIAEGLTEDQAVLEELQKQKSAHLAGRSVMATFKETWGDITELFLADFQKAKENIDDDDVQGALLYNADTAERNAEKMLRTIKHVMGF
jgi:tryptophanyl-tRNA synthetase